MSAWWQWLRLPGWPRVPRALWLTLASLVFCLLNNLAHEEVWPHTPRALPFFKFGQRLALLALLPQLAWVGWCWLRVWQGPVLLRRLVGAAFLAACGLGGLLWLLILVGSVCSLL